MRAPWRCVLFFPPHVARVRCEHTHAARNTWRVVRCACHRARVQAKPAHVRRIGLDARGKRHGRWPLPPLAGGSGKRLLRQREQGQRRARAREHGDEGAAWGAAAKVLADAGQDASTRYRSVYDSTVDHQVQLALDIGQSARAHLRAAFEREDQICRSLLRSSSANPRLLYPRDALCDHEMARRSLARLRKSVPQGKKRRIKRSKSPGKRSLAGEAEAGASGASEGQAQKGGQEKTDRQTNARHTHRPSAPTGGEASERIRTHRSARTAAATAHTRSGASLRTSPMSRPGSRVSGTDGAWQTESEMEAIECDSSRSSSVAPSPRPPSQSAPPQTPTLNPRSQTDHPRSAHMQARSSDARSRRRVLGRARAEPLDAKPETPTLNSTANCYRTPAASTLHSTHYTLPRKSILTLEHVPPQTVHLLTRAPPNRAP